MDNKRLTYAEIDLAAIKHNINIVKKHTTAQIMAVVKADAYGHGVDRVSQVCLDAGVNYLGVATIEEAMHLRDIGISLPILIFGHLADEYVNLAIEHNISITVYDYRFAKVISQKAFSLGKKALIHIKVDTGMGRLGFYPAKAALKEIINIAQLDCLDLEGIYTHLAQADTLDTTFSIQQIEEFVRITNELGKNGLHFRLKHTANSAATLNLPTTHFDMVRPGIILYGLRPSDEVYDKDLQPALKLKSQVTQIKNVLAGATIGYGRTYSCNRPTKIATIPVGYADGYSRILSNQAWGIIKGQKVPLVGNVCMDQCMFDVTDIKEVREGEEILLIGSKADGITADDLANIMGTINYEVVCAISARIPRIYI
ncbi:MAG: alanine racemase [Syntrophomonadaceae bacterium]|nr:alanine racemase [Syntrophomonadaceae bacterium]